MPTSTETRHAVAVTGAFGYSGAAIAQRLTDRGTPVVTLTNHPRTDHPFGDLLSSRPLDFANEDELARSLEGCSTLVNTYWVRINYKRGQQASAVDNTRALFRAAVRAGVQRIVHTSITNPSVNSPYEYFSSKAMLETALMQTGIPHSILRPAVLFGGRDILINNIAWSLRHLPVMGIFGDGSYRIRPIHLDDFADLAVRHIDETGNHLLDAVGPDNPTYRELVHTLARILGTRSLIMGVPPAPGYLVTRLLGLAVHDIIITQPEIAAMMDGLISTDGESTGPTSLFEWARQNAATLGVEYRSDMAQRVGGKR